MNLHIFFLVTFAFISSTRTLRHLPSIDTQHSLERHLHHFAKTHNIPCFLAGYQVYLSDGQPNSKTITAHQRWTFNSDGYANVENSVKCKKETMLRVASVSKSIGSALIGSLVEQGKLNWHDDIHKYVPETIFPKKTWQGKVDNSIINTICLCRNH